MRNENCYSEQDDKVITHDLGNSWTMTRTHIAVRDALWVEKVQGCPVSTNRDKPGNLVMTFFSESPACVLYAANIFS